MDIISKFFQVFFLLKKCFQLMFFYGGTTCKKKLRLVMDIIQKHLPFYLHGSKRYWSM